MKADTLVREQSIMPHSTVLRFARTELLRYLGRIAASHLGDRVRLMLLDSNVTHFNLNNDGFKIESTHTGWTISSFEPRGLLYGVYSFLEKLGCRWYFPGRMGEYFSPKPAVLPLISKIENPTFKTRGLVDHVRAETLEDIIDFAAKCRYNRIYLHPGIEGLNEARRFTAIRGLSIGVKVHAASLLLPRALFAKHPQWFRCEDGRRVQKHNLCVSSRGALETVTANAEKLAAALAIDITDYSLWQDDAKRAWCSCRSCRHLQPAIQNLRLMSAILKGVRKVNRTSRVAYLRILRQPWRPSRWRYQKDCFLNLPHIHGAIFTKQLTNRVIETDF